MGTLVMEILYILFGALFLINAFMISLLSVYDLQELTIMDQLYQLLCILIGIVLIGFAVIFNKIRKY